MNMSQRIVPEAIVKSPFFMKIRSFSTIESDDSFKLSLLLYGLVTGDGVSGYLCRNSVLCMFFFRGGNPLYLTVCVAAVVFENETPVKYVASRY